jgi:hypothetical protein
MAKIVFFIIMHIRLSIFAAAVRLDAIPEFTDWMTDGWDVTSTVR